MLVRDSVLSLTDKNHRSSQTSGQNGCSSGDGRKRRYVGIYHKSSRDVYAFVLNHFGNLITTITARAGKVEIIYSFIEFQIFLPSVWLTMIFR